MEQTEKNNFLIEVGSQTLDLHTPVVMTILNVTPDSFWEGSRRRTDRDIADAAAQAVEQGAAIIDIGGYSSRPGAAEVSPREEAERVARAMEIVRREHPSVVVSVDTFRAEVVRLTVERFGPIVVNDISAGELDPQMIPTVGELDLPYIAMHMRGTPSDMQQHTDYDDITKSVKEYFRSKIEELHTAGIRDIILDPGFGFAKTTEQNYKLMYHMRELQQFGYPLLSGISRKSMIYKVLETTPGETLAGTSALNWESLVRGASILRVHDTREAADIIKIFNYYRHSYEQQ